MIRVSTPFVIAWTFRVCAWGSIGWLLGWRSSLLLVGAASLVQIVARGIEAVQPPPAIRRVLLWLISGSIIAAFAATARPSLWPVAIPAGLGVFVCHAVSFLFDVNRGTASPRRYLPSLLYLVQWPVFPSGPLSRFHEFSHQLARTDVSMASFSYGIRRIVTGLVKVYGIAGPLASTADEIFGLRVTRLSTDAAWLGAVCASLDVYFLVSGFTDVGIGIGRILGFRLQENFRRPYAADSIREFWRRWNVTLFTWLRDYLSLPIAGHDTPTVRRYAITVLGFVVVGLWHRQTMYVLPWAVYTAGWLALEAIGLGALMQRLPRAVRHTYVLLVVMFGWVLLRASAPGPLLGFVESMFGYSVVKFGGSSEYLSLGFVTALVSAMIFAGPLVGWISRWRVSVDAATASFLMMMAATGVLLWHVVTVVRRILPKGRS